MTFREIYENALRMVCEDADTVDTADYEERAAYIFATLCAECASIDKQYRTVHGLSAATLTPTAYVELDSAFPLCDALVSAAVYYLSAMLVMDENESISEKFFALYSDAISTLLAGNSPIADRYGLI